MYNIVFSSIQFCIKSCRLLSCNVQKLIHSFSIFIWMYFGSPYSFNSIKGIILKTHSMDIKKKAPLHWNVKLKSHQIQIWPEQNFLVKYHTLIAKHINEMKCRCSEIPLAIGHNFDSSKTQPGSVVTPSKHNSGTDHNSYLDYHARKTNSFFIKLD